MQAKICQNRYPDLPHLLCASPQAMLRTAYKSSVSSSDCNMQPQWGAPSPADRLQTALSQLRSLIITECTNPDVPGLLDMLAATCTQLRYLELRQRPWLRSRKEFVPGLLRALDQLSSVDAFPALQSLCLGTSLAFETSGVRDVYPAQAVGFNCCTQTCRT
jgi:hypothetical protein